MTLDGLAVDVLVGPDDEALASIVAAGQPVPAPLRLNGYVDTGSNSSVVAVSILQKLGVGVEYQTTTHTVTGTIAVDVYRVSLSIAKFAEPTIPPMVLASLPVMGLAVPIPGAEVLVGLDMLLQCRFALDGPAGTFSIDF